VHQRSAIEGTISELARGHGLRRSRYRGFAKVQLQNLFVAIAGNVKRWLQAILEAIESSLQFLSRTNLLFGVRCLLLATPVELASFSFVSPQGTLIIKSWRQLSRFFSGIEGLGVTLCACPLSMLSIVRDAARRDPIGQQFYRLALRAIFSSKMRLISATVSGFAIR
jgi:hypothetical protein